LNSRERFSISRAFDGVNALDERQAVAELLPGRVGQRSRQQGMRHCVEGRLCGEPEDVVVERTGIQGLTGHLGEPRHPVVDEPLTTFVEFRVSPAEALWGLLGHGEHDEINGQRAEKHAPYDRRRSPEPEQRHYRELLNAQNSSKSPQATCAPVELGCPKAVRPRWPVRRSISPRYFADGKLPPLASSLGIPEAPACRTNGVGNANVGHCWLA
jgi:hypothetical protein